MPAAAPELEYDRHQIEAVFDHSPSFVAAQVFGLSSTKIAKIDVFDHYAVRQTSDGENEIYRLGQYSGPQVAAKIAQAPKDFRATLEYLRSQLETVLTHTANPDALEHHAVLFWPSCNALHAWLGMEPRADEIIVACDILRAQFRLCPVTEAALRAFHEVLTIVIESDPLTSEIVNRCLDILEATGVEHSFPLSFGDAHSD